MRKLGETNVYIRSTMMKISKSAVIVFVLLLLTAGCVNGRSPAPKTATVTLAPLAQIASATNTLTPTLTPTPTPTLTSTPTPTPTPTLTPTPTAMPLNVTGDPRAAQLRDPIPQEGALCGIVDVLDFPLDPPDATSITAGGRDFGVFRSQYDKYHAGEDWWVTRGRSNFGKPVYSIGYGRVTYAEPLGWGRDQGVVIVRHIFNDGSTILSFYGHLDPPSVTLRAGECVTRGQQIGEIGKPRTAPHLHFEIRSHMPTEPGPGYWWEDPTTAGWEPPSQFIWTQRLTSAPGVLWVHEPITNTTTYVGTLFADTVLTLRGTQLQGNTISDGVQLSAFTTISNTASAVLDAHDSVLYTADRLGKMTAFRLTDTRDDTGAGDISVAPLWPTELDVVGTPTLLPLPQGGVALIARGNVFALDTNGRLLWEQDIGGRPFTWTVTDDLLLLAMDGSNDAVWATDGTQPLTQLASFSGYPIMVGAQVWLYAEDGLYRLHLDGQSPELLYALPHGFLDRGSVVALPDGGALVAHADVFDQRLIAFNGDGSVRWQRSYAGVLLSQQQLLRLQDRVYLVSQAAGSQGDITIFAVNLDMETLVRIFVGGTRMPVAHDTWVVAAGGGQMLINIGGGNQLVLDVEMAETAVLQGP